MNHPTDVFDQLFIESFPYYLGLQKMPFNMLLIQKWMIPQLTDAATICQERFTPLLWHQTKRLKLPFDWVYDHPTRDIAELIRYMMIEKRKTGRKQSFNLLQITNEIIRYPHLVGAYYLQGSCSRFTILKQLNGTTKQETKNKKHI